MGNPTIHSNFTIRESRVTFWRLFQSHLARFWRARNLKYKDEKESCLSTNKHEDLSIFSTGGYMSQVKNRTLTDQWIINHGNIHAL